MSTHWPYGLPSTADQVDAGRAARKALPREAQAELTPSRTDPVEILTAQDATRIPELVPVRYERMLVTPFTFYRGAAALMAADLGHHPSSGLTVQLCGDAHLSNFGLFASPERRLVFDLNDFDETHPGPFEWDVKRLAASFELAGRENGLDATSRQRLTARVARGYRQSMARFAKASATQVWYAHLEMSSQLLENTAEEHAKQDLKKARKVTEKAKRRDSRQAVRKLIRMVDGHPEWIADPPFLVPLADLAPERDQASLLEGMAQLPGVVRGLGHPGDPPAAAQLPAARNGPARRRRGQCRHVSLGGAAVGRRPERLPDAAGERGGRVGAGARRPGPL